MAAVEKYTASAVVNIIRHVERTIAHPRNKDIDPARSSLNYALTQDRSMTSYDYFKKRLSEVKLYNRADVKVLAGWVVTAPKDLPADRHRDFFRAVNEFLVARYGAENQISSVVHADEGGEEHLHYLFTPVCEDKKRGGHKICANEILTRKELRNFHPDLQRHLNFCGIDAKIFTGVTKANGGNRTVREMKKERRIKLELKQDRTIDRGRWN